MTWRLIETEACVAEGAEWLAARDARLAAVLAQTGQPPLRRRRDGFGAVLDAIVSQQVSTASARAIWSRLEAAGLVTEDAVAAARDDDLRACGLSRPKVRYARAVALARVDYEALRTLPDDAVIATLIALPGIGRWSAEIYAMFSLGRADVFAAGDLALQESARVALGLDRRPTEVELRAIAADWTPWRAVAARALWAYYRVITAREGVR